MLFDDPISASTKESHFRSLTALNRRTLLRGMGAFGALALIGSRLNAVAAQDDMDDMGTPAVGPREDGSQLWRVQVAGGSMDDGIELFGFYPGEITINAGDAIYFDFTTGMPEIPHTVSFLAGAPVPDLVVPEEPLEIATVTGVQRIMFNPEVAFPKGEMVVDGSGQVSSGMNILLPAGTLYIVEFPTPGTYDFVDLVFPMVATGKVIVLEKSAVLPSTQAAYDKATADAQAPMLDSGREMIAQYSQPTPEDAGNGASKWEVVTGITDGVIEVAAFVPKELHIKAGDTVEWSLEYTQLELHTATFVGADAPPELVHVEPQESGNPKLILNPVLVAPAGEGPYQGQGLANTGFLSSRFPFPQTAEIVFDTPGEYPYYCVIHGSPTQGMRGTIIVE